MSIALLLETQSFRAWFNKTNEIIAALNGNTLADATVANGTFTANGTLRVVDTWKANSSLVLHTGNTRFEANVTATSNVALINFTPQNLTLAPINGTLFNTSISVNAFATFLGTLSANANVVITNGLVTAQDAIFNGTLTSNAGPLVARQIIFASANAIASAALSNPQYDDYAPSGLQECSALHLTPAANTVLTGIAFPTNIGTGMRTLVISNLSGTNKITLTSANTSSAAANRFSLPLDTDVDISPNSSLECIYAAAIGRWRVLAVPAVANATIVNTFSTITVTGNATLANVTTSGNVTVSGATTTVRALVNTSSANLGNGALILNASGNNAAFGNSVTLPGTVTANGSIATGAFFYAANTVQQSFIANLRSTWLAVDNSLGVGGLFSAFGQANFAANIFVIGTGTINTLVAGTAGVSGSLAVSGSIATGTYFSGPATGLTGVPAAALVGNMPYAALPTGSGSWNADPRVTGTFKTDYSASMGSAVARSLNTNYTAGSDGFAVLRNTGNQSGTLYINGSPFLDVNNTSPDGITIPIRKGDVYRGQIGPGGGGLVLYWFAFGLLG